MLAYVLLVATASAAPTLSGPSTKQITIDFFEGTLQGFFDSDTFPHIEACASEATDAYEGIQKAIKEIEQLTPASVKAGIHDLGEAYDSLKAALVDCKAVSADIDRFVKAIEDGFKHPISFLFHLGKECLVNGREIYTEITTAIDDWKAESYKDSGVQIGKALAKILQPSFEAWKLAHGKTYATAEEEAAAREAFLLNADLVASLHMQRAENVYFHLNDFADLSPRQFNERNGLTHTSMMPKTTRMHRLSGRVAPDAVDWRTQGLVADVKNQGSCGSCWAFSTVVSIEGQHAKASGSLVPLSEQNLVDCVKGVKLPNDTDTCCMGCRGGLMNDAFQYMIDSQGGAIDTEASYSYTGRAGTCAFDAANSGATISAWTAIPEGDEAALLDAVATVGPISIAVDASMGWQLYSGGVKDPKLCSSKPEKMDHGVAIVGYGTEAGKDYWIIRNSWGARWGENGYMRIVRGKNACGLANAASYPTGVAQTVEA